MEGEGTNMAGDELDINDIVKDDKSFKVWVAMRMQEGKRTMKDHGEKLDALQANMRNIEMKGLPQCAGMNERVKAIEKGNKLAAMAIGAIGAGAAILSPKAGEWIGRLWGG